MRKGNRRLRGRTNARNKRAFRKVGPTNNLYRNRIPRTLQIATRRPMQTTLRFVKNLTYSVNPGGSSQTPLQENAFLTIRANSIYDILFKDGGQNQPGTWKAQDGSYAPGTPANADGYAEWSARFNQFTVLGSKIQATFEPLQQVADSVKDPATMYVVLSSGTGAVTTSAQTINSIVNLPYSSRVQILQQGTNKSGGQGGRVYSFYSPKKFEGIKDPMSSSILRGHFGNDQGAAAQPSEQSFYNLGLQHTMPPAITGSTQRTPGGIFRVKVEYVVRLTEPTTSNQVSQEANSGFFQHHADL